MRKHLGYVRTGGGRDWGESNSEKVAIKKMGHSRYTKMYNIYNKVGTAKAGNLLKTKKQ
jgi:hypothetical protein